jgi:hypothetical protein
MIKVSFDYDGTIARESIQRYAKELVERGFEVWICTARYDSPERYSDDFKVKYHILDIGREHEQLFADARKCNISFDHIKFMNMTYKAEFFAEEKDFLWHLDDDRIEIMEINSRTNTVGISCENGSSWRHKCERTIKKRLNEKI